MARANLHVHVVRIIAPNAAVTACVHNTAIWWCIITVFYWFVAVDLDIGLLVTTSRSCGCIWDSESFVSATVTQLHLRLNLGPESRFFLLTVHDQARRRPLRRMGVALGIWWCRGVCHSSMTVLGAKIACSVIVMFI